jgi:SsrA-binding protein
MAAAEAAAGRRIAQNRKARRNYQIVETLEAGIVLTGSEVKSLRAGRASIAESYATEKDGELFLVNAHIPVYEAAAEGGHDPYRRRKLLLHKRQLAKFLDGVRRDGRTIVPLSLFFNGRGMVKIQIALAKGKKAHDKRETEKRRDWSRQKARLLRGRG